MTAKEKAKELINFMYDVDRKEDSGFKPIMKWSYAKRCALISVDEIILEYTHRGTSQIWEHPRLEYWNEVKLELEKL
jgi:hypothetical protein